MPRELAGGHGQAMSKPQRHHHREPYNAQVIMAMHREGLVSILGTLASGASRVVGEDLRVATVAALTQIITDLRRDAANLDPVGAVGDVLSDLPIAANIAVVPTIYDVSLAIRRAVDSLDILLEVTTEDGVPPLN